MHKLLDFPSTSHKKSSNSSLIMRTDPCKIGTSCHHGLKAKRGGGCGVLRDIPENFTFLRTMNFAENSKNILLSSHESSTIQSKDSSTNLSPV